MVWHLVNPLMLFGLAGVAIPIIIHLLNRRRAVTVDWGAMQFLELGRRARRKLQITELILMAARMLLLALVALAVTRPFWTPKETVAATGQGGGGAGASGSLRRDVVLILDDSASMDRKTGDTSPREQAIAWIHDFLRRLAPGSTAAILLARDRVQPLVDPPSFDLARVDQALKDVPASRGSSDFPAAIVESLRLLEKTENPAREIVVLTDGQKLPWRAEEPQRWALLRDLHREFSRKLGVSPAVWSVSFGAGAKVEGADGAVGPLELARTLVPPLLPLRIRTTVTNAGPGTLTRTAELLVDGQIIPGASQVVGPVPSGGATPLEFKTTLAEPGAHVLSVRLAPGDDPLAANDESARAVEVTKALPVLLVDGDPGREPLTGETDFLHAALAPTGDETPQVAATVVRQEKFTSENAKGQRVIVLANVDRLGVALQSAVESILASGGGVLVAPGNKIDAAVWNEQEFRNGTGWLPARLGEQHGEFRKKQTVAHPSPPSFIGPSLALFGQGEAPALSEADLFAYRVLVPAAKPAAAVLARLDSGDPWIVERPYRKGRVIVLAGPLDADGGTLPVNPDFVPLMHELVYHLADASSATRSVRPGEPITLDLETPPPATVKELAVVTPSGAKRSAPIEREGSRVRARLSDTFEPGVYQVMLPTPPGGSAFVAVEPDSREADLTPLTAEDRTRLAQGWPLEFAADPAQLASHLLVSERGRQHPIWRLLILAALGSVCLEIALTRQLVKSRGLADVRPEG